MTYPFTHLPHLPPSASSAPCSPHRRRPAKGPRRACRPARLRVVLLEIPAAAAASTSCSRCRRGGPGRPDMLKRRDTPEPVHRQQQSSSPLPDVPAPDPAALEGDAASATISPARPPTQDPAGVQGRRRPPWLAAARSRRRPAPPATSSTVCLHLRIALAAVVGAESSPDTN
jgi:hypothetical protein